MLVLGAAALTEIVRVEGYANRKFAGGKPWTFHTDAWYAMALGVPEHQLTALTAIPDLEKQALDGKGQSGLLLRLSGGRRLNRTASTHLVTAIFLDGMMNVYEGEARQLERFISRIERRTHRPARAAAEADRREAPSDILLRHTLLIDDLRLRSDGARAFALNVGALLGEQIAPLSSRLVEAWGATDAPFVLRSILDNWSAFKDAMVLHALVYEDDCPIRHVKTLSLSLPYILHFNHVCTGIAIELLDTVAARLDCLGRPSNRTRTRAWELRKAYERQIKRYLRNGRSAPLAVLGNLPDFGAAARYHD